MTLTPLSSLRTYLPGYLSGVCVPSSSLTTCDPELCSCCGDWCCPSRYRDMWLDMACVSHIQCRTWGTGIGQICCLSSIMCPVCLIQIKILRLLSLVNGLIILQDSFVALTISAAMSWTAMMSIMTMTTTPAPPTVITPAPPSMRTSSTTTPPTTPT